MNLDTILHGDALATLRTLPSESVHCVITSPPYFWQRDYGAAGQIGHEDTLDGYVEALAQVFDACRRVLRHDGALYLNLGDTYYSGKGKPCGQDTRAVARNFARRTLRAVDRSGWPIPPKSLVLAPFLVAQALQRRGWTLRSDIIWHRPNAQPEPTARDRPHRRHEHLFLFSASRRYYYDRTALGGDEDVWTIPASSVGAHSAAFPEALAERCILTASRVGGVVLDPFMGAGTVGVVARKHARHYLGIELNADYIALAEARIVAEIQPVLWSIAQ